MLGGRFFWFGLFDDENCIFSIRYFQPYGTGHTEFDQSPCPELLAANGLARTLEGMSHPYCRVRNRNAVWVLGMFRRLAVSLFAEWRSRDHKWQHATMTDFHAFMAAEHAATGMRFVTSCKPSFVN